MSTASVVAQKLPELKHREINTFITSVTDTVDEPFTILDTNFKVLSANKKFYDVFKVHPEETIGQFIYDVGDRQFDIPKLHEFLEKVLPKKTSAENYEIEHSFKTAGSKVLLVNAKRLEELNVVFLGVRDVTEYKRLEAIKTEGQKKYEALFFASRDAIMILEPPSWSFTSGNPATVAMFRTKDEEEFLSYSPWELSPEFQPNGRKSKEMVKEQIEKALRYGSNFFEWVHKRVTGETFYADVLLSKVKGTENTYLEAVIRDISERKIAEKVQADKSRLSISNEMFQQVIETLPVRIFWKDRNSIYLGCNDLIVRDAGKQSQKDIIGHSDYDMVWKAQADAYTKDDREVMMTQKPKINIEEPQTTPHGDITWLRTNKIPLRNQEDEVIGVLGTYEDITERKKTEEALRVSEEKYRTLVNSLNDGIFIVQDEKIQYINDTFATIVGYSLKEVIGKKFQDFLTPTYKELVTKRYYLRQQGKKVPKEYEIQILHKNGIPIDVLINASVITYNGKMASMGVLKNITEQKKLQKKIIEDKSKDEAILESIGDAVFACDMRGIIIVFNSMAEKLTGVLTKEALGQPYHRVLSFIKESDNTPSEDFIAKTLKTNKITKMVNHTLLLKKDGSKLAIADSAAPIRNDNGETIGCVVAFHDVTHEREIDKAKTEFVSLASHQLRTPLTTINWYSEALLSEGIESLTNKQQEYLKETHNASKRMVNLIDALLNVSRLELGTFSIEPESVHIQELIGICVKDLEAVLVKRNIQFHETYDPPDIVIRADRKLLGIVITNLLSNAFKYTPSGGRVDLSVQKQKEGFRIIVKDTGIGIPENQQDKIFNKLFRADNAKKIDPDGTGLGLYIVYSIITNSDGKIWFDTKEGGTTFYVTLPLSGMTKKVGTKQLV